jgi:hypothetical protein
LGCRDHVLFLNVRHGVVEQGGLVDEFLQFVSSGWTKPTSRAEAL